MNYQGGIFMLGFGLLTHVCMAVEYDIRQLSDLSGWSEQMVVEHMQEFQASEDWNEGTAFYYGVFSQLINTYQLKVGCEIGIATGGHSYDILKKTNVEKLYCVDPFSPGLYPEWAARGILNLYFLRIKFRFAEFGNRVEMVRKYSQEAATLFSDGQLDFVFIDADHHYVYVIQDLEAWYPKIRSGGVIGGDDYATQWPGVPRAVNEFFQAHGLTVHTDKQEPRIWWVHKP